MIRNDAIKAMINTMCSLHYLHRGEDRGGAILRDIAGRVDARRGRRGRGVARESLEHVGRAEPQVEAERLPVAQAGQGDGAIRTTINRMVR